MKKARPLGTYRELKSIVDTIEFYPTYEDAISDIKAVLEAWREEE